MSQSGERRRMKQTKKKILDKGEFSLWKASMVKSILGVTSLYASVSRLTTPITHL